MKATMGYEIDQLTLTLGSYEGAREEAEYLWVCLLRLYPALSKQAAFRLALAFTDDTHSDWLHPKMWLVNWTDETLEFACEAIALTGRFLLDGHNWIAEGFGRKSREILWDEIQRRHVMESL